MAALLLTGLTGCRKQVAADAGTNVEYYTCAMHPSVKLYDPKAKCPFCGMNLVPVLKNGTEVRRSAIPNEFSVPVEQQRQFGVTYATVEKKPLRRVLRAAGVVEADKTRHWEFVARFEGYVQKLNITSRGESVEEGQPLLTIYSPELFTAERDFVNLLDAQDRATTEDAMASATRSIDTARHRLEQRTISATQIAELEKSRKPSEIVTLTSPFKGVVEDVFAEQGRRVMIDDRLVSIADLSVVWVWAEYYEDDLSLLAKGRKVTITTDAYLGRTFEGELSLVDPFLAGAKRTVRVRIDMPNPDLRLRPGMYVDVQLVDMGEGLTIPVSAVMPTGSHEIVFVDTTGGRLAPRVVRLGGKYGELYEVLDGLKAGERVVASANFLIDAESRVQGALKSFDEPPMDGTDSLLMTQPTPLRNGTPAMQPR